MIKVFGIFVADNLAPEIIAATSDRDAIKRAIANNSIQRHEVRDADIRELTADEIVFWSDRPVSDHELMLDALKRNHTPAGEMVRKHLSGEQDLLIKDLPLEVQRDCWQALAWALIGYKPSVQRDRLIKEVENEVWFTNHELHQEFLASMMEEIEDMEEFCDAA